MPVVDPYVESARAGGLATPTSTSTRIPKIPRLIGEVSLAGRSGAGDRRGGRVAARAVLLAPDVLLDRLDVVLGAGDHGEQVVHRGDLLDLLLDEPLHELLGGEVVLLAGRAGQCENLLGDALLLGQRELDRG